MNDSSLTKTLAQNLRETAEVLANNGLPYWVAFCVQAADELERRSVEPGAFPFSAYEGGQLIAQADTKELLGYLLLDSDDEPHNE
jgi:hypothetical protein